MKRKYLMLVLLTGAIGFTSCKKGDSNKNKEMSEEDCADLVETSVSSDDGGVSEDFKKAADIVTTEYQTFQFDCSFSDDTTYVLTKNSGVRTYDLTSTLSWEVSCTNAEVYAITFTLAKSGTYTGPRIIRNGNASGTFTFSELASTATYYELNGTITETGNSEFTAGAKTGMVNTTATITLSDIQVNKQTYALESGSTSITVLGETESGSKTYTASLEYNSGTVNMEINGTAYTFQI